MTCGSKRKVAAPGGREEVRNSAAISEIAESHVGVRKLTHRANFGFVNRRSGVQIPHPASAHSHPADLPQLPDLPRRPAARWAHSMSTQATRVLANGVPVEGPTDWYSHVGDAHPGTLIEQCGCLGDSVKISTGTADRKAAENACRSCCAGGRQRKPWRASAPYAYRGRRRH
jgi:hypothetical protein